MNKISIQALLGLSIMLLAIGCGSEDDEHLDRMADEHEGDTPVENAASDLSQSAEASGQEVTYATVTAMKLPATWQSRKNRAK